MELEKAIETLLPYLSEAEAMFFRLRSGLGGEPRQTLESVARVRGVTRERIRQIEDGATEKLQRLAPLLEEDFETLAIAALTEKERAVLDRRCADNWPMESIAQELGMGADATERAYRKTLEKIERFPRI